MLALIRMNTARTWTSTVPSFEIARAIKLQLHCNLALQKCKQGPSKTTDSSTWMDIQKRAGHHFTSLTAFRSLAYLVCDYGAK